MRVLLDVAAADLPEPFRRLVDAEVPLTHPERFAPAPRDGGFLSWVIALGCLLLVGLLLRGLLPQLAALAAGDSFSTPNLVLGALFLGPLLWWAGRQLTLIRRGRAQARALAAGRYRRGVFFDSSAALVSDGLRHTLIPRGKVVRIDRKPAENTESGARALGTYIIFKGPGGREHARAVTGVAWDGRVRVWHKSGRVPS